MFDVAKHLGAVTRAVEDSTHEGTPVKVVVASRTYPTDIDDLWQAVTDPERIARWFAPVSGDLRLGGRFQVEGNAGGEVTACDEPKHFAISWEFGDQTTWVDVDLETAGDTTTLTLRHAADVRASEHWATYGPGAVGVGWELGLMGLAEHLATGTPIAHEQVEGWGASADGLAFMSGSATEWGEADAASSDDPAASRAAAARTAAFYTGAEPSA
ncbi:SRPBCC family protein [Nocardioides sp. zg-1228]|uniref:SRPBCC family protein n=1 Tax=Nocardioides sp. zg-1228 TaxID=2763008 RepID=UPI0016426915|nr:SRPBCC family protein [Nocardioides sp. zg-1228]MBC2931772.1 SRPBCC family protein [Nocardioides sp. zg-1228]QSF57353.1 SRPBCC family protein [Nocardioides sp. zg-1228]